MHRLNLPLLQDIAREQGEHQERDQDEQRPGAEELLLAGLGNLYPLLDVIRKVASERASSKCVPSSGSVSESIALSVRPNPTRSTH